LSLNPAYNTALASLEASGHAQFIPGAGWVAVDRPPKERRTDPERCAECSAAFFHADDCGLSGDETVKLAGDELFWGGSDVGIEDYRS
jgi:hypothetical protein